jgi:predicted phosphodiesterase
MVGAVIRRFAVLGDIHAEDVRLAAVLERLAGERHDAILSVGDVVDGRGDPDRTIELLAQHGVITVRGNHDRWLPDGKLLSDAERRIMGWSVAADMKPSSLEWLAARPVTETLVTVAGPLLLCHAVGDDDMTKVYAETPDPLVHSDEMRDIVDGGRWRLVVCGHTHERWVARFACGGSAGGDVWWLNAGTLSVRGEPGYMTVDLEARVVRFFDVAADGAITDAERVPLVSPTGDADPTPVSA